MNERLQEIKHLVGYVNKAVEDDDGNNVITTLIELFSEGHIDWLIQQAELSREWQLVATDRFNDWYKADQLNNRYKQALELVEDELEYAKTTGNDEVRDMYIKNSIRFINKALEREG